MSFGCVPYDLLGREKKKDGEVEGREGKVLMTYERKDHPWRSNPAVLPHGFTQKSYLSRSLPASHLCVQRGGATERERETASPFNLGTGSRYAGQNNCLATWNLLQWMERERGFQPVGFSTYFFFCKFWNLILRVSHVTNFSTFLLYLSINLRQ